MSMGSCEENIKIKLHENDIRDLYGKIFLDGYCMEKFLD
jgi:hypothetical protein